MKIAWCLFFVNAVASAASLTEADCPSRDFSEQMGLIRNQTNANWCWAFTAADLITFAQGTKNQVSAIDVAVSSLSASPENLREAFAKPGDFAYFQDQKYKRDFEFKGPRLRDPARTGNSFRNRGSNDEVTLYNLREHVCLESEVPSQAPRAYSDYAKFEKPLFEDKEGMSFIEARLKALGDFSVDEADSRIVGDPFGGCANRDPAMPGLSFIQAYNQKILVSLNQNLKSKCKQGPLVKPMKTESDYFDKYSDHQDGGPAKIAQWLGEGTPLRMNYDGNFFQTEEFTPVFPRKVNHVSVVAGMKWNAEKKACEFKVRGSWGASCFGYPKRFDGRCDGGNIWVSEEEIRSLVSGIDRIKP